MGESSLYETMLISITRETLQQLIEWDVGQEPTEFDCLIMAKKLETYILKNNPYIVSLCIIVERFLSCNNNRESDISELEGEAKRVLTLFMQDVLGG